MAETRVVLHDEVVQKALKKVNSQYRSLIMKEISMYLDNVRLNAVDEIIPNKTGAINPGRASRLQRSVPGKLTSRTGKLVWGLKEKTSRPGAGFSGGRYSRKKQTALFLMRVVRTIVKKDLEQYKGKIIYSYVAHGRLTSTGNKADPNKRMPQENERSFLFRMKWDTTGMKGSGKRPFITPAAHKTFQKLPDITQKRLERLMDLV